MESHIYNEIINALQPLVDIANAYDMNELDDEARKYWGAETIIMNDTPHTRIELYTGRGGKRLLTLHDCMVAREVSNNLKKLMGAA